jgi:hypothetical protein
VSLSFRGRRARGRITVADGFGNCRSGARVRLERRVGRRWRLSTAGSTNAAGRYTLRVPSVHGVYRASLSKRTLPYGHVCAAARSPLRRR